MDLARERWTAPTAPSPFSLMASALPNVQAQLPIAEATLINIAIRGAVVDQSTPLEAVLEFREKNTELAGRLRAALGEVADSIRVDLPMSAVVEQAEAAIKNRVEPALGALKTELQRGRISFVWSNVLGLGGIAATAMHPTAATLGTGAQLVGRGLRYAFDRDALVRDHPFGHLHRVRTTFGEDRAKGSALDSVAAPMTAPRMELETLLGKMYLAAFGAGDGSFNRAMIGERGTDPGEVFDASDAHFARMAGVAPVPVSSGRQDRHRLDRGGNRQLNRALHIIAITRGRIDPETRAYLARKEAEGKSRMEAMRCLKRHLARRYYRLLSEGSRSTSLLSESLPAVAPYGEHIGDSP